jgi:hypothetical protein
MARARCAFMYSKTHQLLDLRLTPPSRRQMGSTYRRERYAGGASLTTPSSETACAFSAINRGDWILIGQDAERLAHLVRGGQCCVVVAESLGLVVTCVTQLMHTILFLRFLFRVP